MAEGHLEGTVKTKDVAIDGVYIDVRVERHGTSCVVHIQASETRPGEPDGNDGAELYLH